MNPVLPYFQIQMEYKRKSVRLTEAASNKAFYNKPLQGIWVFVSILSLKGLFKGGS